MIDIVIYLDLYFLINVLMDMLILNLLMLIEKKKMFSLRVVIGALIGGISAVLYLAMGRDCPIWLLMLQGAAFGGLMIFTVLGWEPVRKMIRHVMFLYLLSFVVGGIIYYIYDALLEREMSILSLLTCMIILMGLGKYLIPRLYRWVGWMKHNYPVEVIFHGKVITGMGLMDTGNHLREPISGEPVLVIEQQIFDQILEPDEIAYIHEFPDRVNRKIKVRCIPYQSLGKRKGMLLGVRAEYARIYTGEKWIMVARPWIGLSKEKISTQGDYQMLLGQELFE